METLLNVGAPIVELIAAMLVVFVLNFLRSKYKITKQDEEIADALKTGVSHTWKTFVKGAKERSSDGKLTTEEAKGAVNLAFNTAKQELTGSTLKAFVKWGLPKIQAKIESYVREAKK